MAIELGRYEEAVRPNVGSAGLLGMKWLLLSKSVHQMQNF